MNRLQGKVALITGGGAGIGAAAGRIFCAEGAAVVLVDANAEALAKTKQRIEGEVSGARALTLAADVADEARAAEAVKLALESFKRLDVLVNNAGMRNYSAVADATSAEWQAVLGVNLLGAANYCRAALPALRASGKGAIVNVSSVHGVAGRKGMGLYDSTKAGLLAMTRTLACEEAAHGVRANAVCPGSTLTDFHVARARAAGKSVEKLKTERADNSLLGRWATPQEVAHGVRANAVCPGSTLTDFHVARARAAGKSVEKLKTERADNSLLGRWATPEEVAWPILWLASDEASFITGSALMVDGGLSAI